MTIEISEKPGMHPSMDDPRCRIKTSQHMAASCAGALITSLVVTPLDVVKVRIQSQQKNLLSSKCYLYCNGLMDHLCTQCPGEPKTYSTKFTGTIDAFTKISRSEGIGTLWSGLGPTLVLAVPATMVYFVSYEKLKLFVKDRYHGTQPTWGPMMSGAIARIFAVTLVSPLELVRTKMQSKQISYQEIGEAIKSLFHRHGPRGLFKGLGSTLLRDVPFSGIYWSNYEYFKSRYVKSGEPSFWMSFLNGAMSGSIAALITNPYDVVKTHQQLEFGEKEICSEPPQKNTSSIRAVMERIYVRQGVSGFFSGLAPRLIKVAPACAIMISTFECGKQFFHAYNIKHGGYCA